MAGFDGAKDVLGGGNEKSLDPLFEGTDISLLDLLKIQAQVLVPVLKAFRAEIGEEKANSIAMSALRDWSKRLYHGIGDAVEGTPRQKWESITAAFIPRVGDDIDVEFLKQEDDALDYNVNSCRYAEFFRQLGEPELGALLTCDADRVMEEVGGDEVTLGRTQTIMKGAKYCDFRFRMKSGG